MIAHLTYVRCDGCGNPAPAGDDAREARAYAAGEGFIRRNRKDVCPACQCKERHPGTVGDRIQMDDGRYACHMCQQQAADRRAKLAAWRPDSGDAA